MRKKLIAIVAAIGIALAATSVAIIGTSAFAANADFEKPPATQINPEQSTNPNEPDIYEETLDLPPNPLTTDPKAVPDTDAEWSTQFELMNQCMTDKGFPWWDDGGTGAGSSDLGSNWSTILSADEAAAVRVALWGDISADVYRWEDAGCHGYVVHVTGNDGNH